MHADLKQAAPADAELSTNAPAAWVPVGELAAAMAVDSHILPAVKDLAGQHLVLQCVDGTMADYHFLSSAELVCDSTGTALGGQGNQRHEAAYRATTLRPGIYFVDYVSQHDPARAISLVLDVVSGMFTVVCAEMPRMGEPPASPLARARAGVDLTPVTATFSHGTLGPNPPAGARLHEPTRELIGKRVQYVYSPTETYEHIYLNDRFYTWHCLRGLEAGLCDTDRCHYYRIDDQLYLFVWREKIIPTAGVVLVDLKRNKTSGKIFGYSSNAGESVSNFPVGAFAKVLNMTSLE